MAAKPKPDKQQTRWKLDRIKEHPRQAKNFDVGEDAAIALLIDDMAKNGQQHPIEVLPDGTAVAGHRRTRAARKLGWKEIDVIVRYDLAKAGPDAIERYMISDNYLRRHLSPLGKARSLSRLMELELKEPLRLFGSNRMEQLKYKVGKTLGLSGRSVSRYLAVLETPVEVQAALEAGRLKLVVASRVAGLSICDRERVAAAIRAGEEPSAVVARYMPASSYASNPSKAFARLVRCVKQEVPILRGQLDKVSNRRRESAAETFKQAIALFREIVGDAE